MGSVLRSVTEPKDLRLPFTLSALRYIELDILDACAVSRRFAADLARLSKGEI
jgi:hypothetical protein